VVELYGLGGFAWKGPQLGLRKIKLEGPSYTQKKKRKNTRLPGDKLRNNPETIPAGWEFMFLMPNSPLEKKPKGDAQKKKGSSAASEIPQPGQKDSSVREGKCDEVERKKARWMTAEEFLE